MDDMPLIAWLLADPFVTYDEAVALARAAQGSGSPLAIWQEPETTLAQAEVADNRKQRAAK
jgi:hypothetical protein